MGKLKARVGENDLLCFLRDDPTWTCDAWGHVTYAPPLKVPCKKEKRQMYQQQEDN